MSSVFTDPRKDLTLSREERGHSSNSRVSSAELNPCRGQGHSSKHEGILSIRQSKCLNEEVNRGWFEGLCDETTSCSKVENSQEKKRNILHSIVVNEGIEGGHEGRVSSASQVEVERGRNGASFGVTASFPADFETTGHGEQRDSCGVFFTKGCLESHLHESMDLPKGVCLQIGLDGKSVEYGVYYERWVHRCFRQACPVCWEKWAFREMNRATRRLLAFKLKGRNLKPIHVVVGIPHADYGLGIAEMRKKVYRALKTVHLLGGMCIYHPKRWKKGIAYYSPHFHIIGYGWLTDVRKNYIASGYVVKNLRIRKTVEGTIWYQLSHAGVHPKHHTVTWFGCLSYNKLRIPKDEPEEHCCPFCMGKLKQILWIGDGDCPVPNVEGFKGYGDAQGWVYADVLRRAGGTKRW